MTLRVAIVGSGMAGLTAAHRCKQAGFEVTVFEAHGGFGMDAHSLDLYGGRVDVPLRVMSPEGWQALLALADEVGVGRYRVDTHISCSNSEGQTWFKSGRMALTGWPIIGSLRYANGKALRIGRAMAALSSALRSLQRSPSDITLAEFVRNANLDPLFWRGVLLPVLSTICTCSERHLLNWPAQQLLAVQHELAHGSRPQRLEGGTSALVAALARDIVCIGGSPVQQIVEHGKQLRVRNQRGDEGLFDRVVVATQANQLEFLAGERYVSEREVLAGIRYDRGELIVHSDQRFMPARRSDWVALNFQSDPDLQSSMFTVWVNAVEPTLAGKTPVFQTWNPLYPIDPSLELARVPLQRAVVHAGNANILDQLQRWHQQPGRRLFYCGSWAHPGVPLLETAVRSAESVVKLIVD